jgi:hypothetical protein
MIKQQDRNAHNEAQDEPDATKTESESRPRQPPYGRSENFGSPGGDEPPPGTDPGRGSPTDARERQ